jgi:hypothetical protein
MTRAIDRGPRGSRRGWARSLRYPLGAATRPAAWVDGGGQHTERDHDGAAR